MLPETKKLKEAVRIILEMARNADSENIDAMATGDDGDECLLIAPGLNGEIAEIMDAANDLQTAVDILKDNIATGMNRTGLRTAAIGNEKSVVLKPATTSNTLDVKAIKQAAAEDPDGPEAYVCEHYARSTARRATCRIVNSENAHAGYTENTEIAAARGTRLHDVLYRYLRNGRRYVPDDATEAEARACLTVDSIIKRRRWVLDELERDLPNPDAPGHTLRPDAIGHIYGHDPKNRIIVDYKNLASGTTPRELSERYGETMRRYARAVEKHFGGHVEAAYLILLCPDGRYLIESVPLLNETRNKKEEPIYWEDLMGE